MSPAQDDLARLEAMRAGDAAALAELYRLHGGVIYRFALAMVRDTDIAADAVQDTFVWLASDGAMRFDPSRSSLAAFLCGVVRNHVFRRREIEARYVSVTQPDGETGSENWDNETTSSLGEFDASGSEDEHALTALLRRERKERLLHALRELPSEHREVLILVEFEEMSYEDAASIIGCPIGTVRSRLHRAKAALKSRLLASNPELAEPENCHTGIRA